MRFAALKVTHFIYIPPNPRPTSNCQMTETNPRLFTNSDLLLSRMGHWPSFHDAKVMEVVRESDSCRSSLRVFE